MLDIRREHPSASVSLILATLTEEGYFEKSKVSEPTVRRLYAAAGLSRCAKRGGAHLATLYPLDKIKNADMKRRRLPEVASPPAPSPKPAGIAPLLRELMAE